MKELPPIEIIEEIAIEFGVDSSFVEKDWFATQILSEIAQFKSTEIVFAGGTSLSKGYNLIKRFSEDLDFRIITASQKINRKITKPIRNEIISEIKKIPDISLFDEPYVRNEGKFFSLNIEYPQRFALSEALRPHLKLEFCFEKPILEPKCCEIRSFVTSFTKAEVDCKINTISPIETAANKFSALLWRINIHNRSADSGTTENDPTMLRHLHDLAALFNYVKKTDNFQNVVEESFKRDRGRKGSDKLKSLKEFSLEAVGKLKTDHIYSKEYTQFVTAMSYAPNDERIGFDS